MAANKLIVWGARTARPMRVLWMLEEFGLDYEHRPIGSRTGETMTEQYLALNPKHKIPVLQDGDFVLTESAAILNHLAAKYDAPEGFYAPDGGEERSRMLEWCFFIMMELDALGIYVIRRHDDLGDLYGHAPNVVQSARDYIHDGLGAVMKLWPDGQDWLMAGGFGIPDILMVTTLDYALQKQIDVPERLMDHYRCAHARPAYGRAREACFPD